jgi:hypothetical protein
MMSRLALVVLLAGCGSNSGFGNDGGLDASALDATTGDGASDASDGGPSFGDSSVTDASCGFGSAGNFATQSSLDLFGQTVFFVDGGPLPAGHYQIAYVDGCMKYSAPQDWTVNAYAEDAGNDHWWLVRNASGSDTVLTPPGTSGYLVDAGGYATFTDCVNANLLLDKPKEFDFDGGPLGLWLADSPYTDNVAGDNGRNPKWSLTLVGQPCPN